MQQVSIPYRYDNNVETDKHVIYVLIEFQFLIGTIITAQWSVKNGSGQNGFQFLIGTIITLVFDDNLVSRFKSFNSL